ncbi:PREDICTED: uncharacterized protein LOC108550885 [Eufriesea mexicana]|uniref:uncharacterized protein LOC108550885 n=1 Tax=Eufriesea mexicana TaxID=516756 RepID=UPI00083C3CEE|nr:PREDICTED: uncharacterized protein LOC108550885 [Eufriesea mexicana]
MDKFIKKNAASKSTQYQTQNNWTIRKSESPLARNEFEVIEVEPLINEYTNVGIDASENSKKRKVHNNADTGNGEPSTSKKSSNSGPSTSKEDIPRCECCQRYTDNREPYCHSESAYRNHCKLLKEEGKIPKETWEKPFSMFQDMEISQTTQGVQVTPESQTSVCTKSHENQKQKQTLTTPRKSSKQGVTIRNVHTITANTVSAKIDRLTILIEQKMSILMEMILELRATIEKLLCSE